MKQYFQPEFLLFFESLAKNNNKEWFDLNRKTYLEFVKQPFELLVGDLIHEINLIDEPIHSLPKDCIFRINKDIRFAKDKVPYKLHVSALFSKNGRKDHEYPSYYLEIAGNKFSLAGGLYSLEKESLLKARYYIGENYQEFQKVINNIDFLSVFGGMKGEKNQRLSGDLKGAEINYPELLCKQFYFWKEYPVSLITSDQLLPEILKAIPIAKPVNDFLRKAIIT